MSQQKQLRKEKVYLGSRFQRPGVHGGMEWRHAARTGSWVLRSKQRARGREQTWNGTSLSTPKPSFSDTLPPTMSAGTRHFKRPKLQEMLLTTVITSPRTVRSSAEQVSGNTSKCLHVRKTSLKLYKYTSISPELTKDKLLDHFSTYLFFLCQFLPSFGVCSCFQYGASSCSARPSF